MTQGQIRGVITSLKPTKVTIHHNFIQFGKQNSRTKAILSSIVLSEQCCGAHYISLAVAKAVVRFNY